ncbi:hypothetical protein B0H13DRAFT_1961167 [Mycena leptocephala]|nr:hypothetical protein B0H13DRAFT_1961167 [Mycena leptocephala]
MKGLDGILSVRYLSSLFLLSLSSIGGSSSRVWDSRRAGHGRVCMRALVLVRVGSTELALGMRASFVRCLRAGACDVYADTSAHGASLRCRRRTGTPAGCMRSASLFPIPLRMPGLRLSRWEVG